MSLIIALLFLMIVPIALSKSRIEENRSLKIDLFSTQKVYLFLTFLYVIIVYSLFILFNLTESLLPDEAVYFASAKSIVENGKDLQGYTLPCYNSTWGWGTQSILYIYLAAGVMHILGVNLIVFRLPMFLLIQFAVLFGVSHCKKYYGLEKSNWLLVFILSNPILLQISLRTLDSTIIFPLIVIAITLLDKGLKKQQNVYFYIASVVFGLLYYAYALALPFVSLFLIMFAVYYLIKYKKVKVVMISAIIVFIVGYCGIAGWISILTNIKLPNILQYPDVTIERVEDVGFGLENLYVFIMNVERFLVYSVDLTDRITMNFYIMQGLFIPSLCLFTFLELSFIALVDNIKQRKRINIFVVLLLIAFICMNFYIKGGSDIKYYFLIIVFCWSAVYIMTSLSRKSQLVMLCLFLLVNVTYNTQRNKIVQMNYENVNINSLSTNVDFIETVKYIEKNNIEDVTIYIDSEYIKEYMHIATLNDYVYTLQNIIYLYDSREQIGYLINDKEYNTKFKNYTFEIIRKKEQSIKTIDREGYNLVMNSVLKNTKEKYTIEKESATFTLIEI